MNNAKPPAKRNSRTAKSKPPNEIGGLVNECLDIEKSITLTRDCSSNIQEKLYAGANISICYDNSLQFTAKLLNVVTITSDDSYNAIEKKMKTILPNDDRVHTLLMRDFKYSIPSETLTRSPNTSQSLFELPTTSRSATQTPTPILLYAVFFGEVHLNINKYSIEGYIEINTCNGKAILKQLSQTVPVQLQNTPENMTPVSHHRKKTVSSTLITSPQMSDIAAVAYDKDAQIDIPFKMEPIDHESESDSNNLVATTTATAITIGAAMSAVAANKARRTDAILNRNENLDMNSTIAANIDRNLTVNTGATANMSIKTAASANINTNLAINPHVTAMQCNIPINTASVTNPDKNLVMSGGATANLDRNLSRTTSTIANLDRNLAMNTGATANIDKNLAMNAAASTNANKNPPDHFKKKWLSNSSK